MNRNVTVTKKRPRNIQIFFSAAKIDMSNIHAQVRNATPDLMYIKVAVQGGIRTCNLDGLICLFFLPLDPEILQSCTSVEV